MSALGVVGSSDACSAAKLRVSSVSTFGADAVGVSVLAVSV